MPIIILSIFVLVILFLQALAYKRLWNRGLTYNVRFSAKEAFEGDTVQLREEVANKKFLPLPWLNTRIQVPVEFTFINRNGEFIPPDGKGSSLFAIFGYTAVRRRHRFVCTRRGIYNLREAQIFASDILHTSRYEDSLMLRGELLVFPKILDDFDNLDLVYKQLDSAIMSKKIIDPDPFEFRGIRDYQPTDPLKSINFKASAIAQSLMVNIHAPTTAQKLVLVLNLDSLGPWLDPEIYEQSIRLAATLAGHYIEQGAQLSFATNGRDSITGEPMLTAGGTSGGHLYRILECLARVSTSYQRAPMVEYMQNLTDREMVYLFISPYQGEELMGAFEGLAARGVSACMVVPYIGDDIQCGSNAIAWKAG